MRMKSLMTAAEAAGYVMAPLDEDYADDATTMDRLALPSPPSAIVPDAPPAFHAPTPVYRGPLGLDPRALTEACMRSYMSFSQIISRRAAA